MSLAAEVSVNCKVNITINDPDVLDQVTGPNGDEWRANFYKLFNVEDVLGHLAFNCIANGIEIVTALDGWAGLPADAATMELDRGSIECETVRLTESTK